MSIGYTGDNGTLDADGWTIYKPSLDSRLIYVAPDGNDTTAATAKGRGYYLPTDPEIGPDPTNPVGPIDAYATHFEAAKRVRLSSANGEDADGFPLYASGNPSTGYPDWILLKRGGSYLQDPELTHPNNGATASRNLGELLGGAQQSGIGWDQSRGRLFYYCGPWRGRSASEPAVVTAWGNESDPRPVVSSWTTCGGARHIQVMSLDLQGICTWGWGNTTDNTSGDVLLEDIRVQSLGSVNSGAGPSFSYDRGLVLRRCTAQDNFSPSGHNQGFFFNSPVSKLLIEECVFDRNGYKEDPNEPTTWTGNFVSDQVAGELPAGTGVQPTRTYFDRNLYLSSYDECILRGNIVSRGGGGGSVQMRRGGVAERNLFIWNETALGMIHPEGGDHFGALIKDNLVLHDDHFLPPGGWGQGLGGGGWDDDIAVIDGNIVTHFHRQNNGGASIWVSGKNTSTANPTPYRLQNTFILNNAVYREYGGIGIEVAPTTHTWGVSAATVSGNKVSTPSYLSLQGDPSKPATFTYSGNRFHSTTNNGQFRWAYHNNNDKDWRIAPYTNGTFAEWQAAGYDADATFTTDFSAFKSSVGWIAPERDIVSYMQFVDPTYLVNEDVYVDDGTTGTKQTVRQKVWEVLTSNVDYGNFPEARAKEAARRYHAFLSFIDKALTNRKGNWDTRWTAETVNNYIREGFNLEQVSGNYTATQSSIYSYAEQGTTDDTGTTGATGATDDTGTTGATGATDDTGTTVGTGATTDEQNNGEQSISIEYTGDTGGIGAVVNQVSSQNYIYPTYYRFTIAELPKLEYSITKVTLPSFGYDSPVDQVNRFTLLKHPANRVSFGPLELEFLVDEDMENWLEISNWIRRTSVVDDHMDIMENTKKHFTQGTLLITNSAMVPNLEVTFYNMFPISITGFQFDSSVTELTPWISTVNFAYDYYQIKKL